MAYDHITSGAAYHGTKESNRDYCRQQVLIAVKKLQPCTDRQISEYLNWPINRVTPRRGELVDSGAVVLAMKEPDPLTNRTVNFWQIKPDNYQPRLY